MRFNESTYPTFATALALKELGIQEIGYESDEGLISLTSAGGTTRYVPVDANGQMLIYYHGPYRTFRYISVHSLLNDIYPNNAQTNFLEFFRNKVVFVGASAAGLYDLRATPRQPSFPGIEVHTNIFHQLMKGHFIRQTSTLKQILVILALGLISGLIFAATSPTVGIISGLLLSASYVAANLFAFNHHQLWLPMVAPLLTIFATFSIQYVYRYVVEERSKRAIRNVFSRYVSSNVVEELLKNPDKVALGGEKRVCTVLFSDLAGFTTWSEQSEPEELVKLLNHYFTEMTHIIFKNGGTLDKYQGDAIMAIFGAPMDVGNHAAQACKAALEMQMRLEEVRKSWAAAGLPQLVQRIGINTGQMIVGNMGSDIRFDYTVIGDSVNLGARLEGVNKVYGTATLISETTLQMAGDAIITRPLDLIRVKGKKAPVRIHDLVGVAGEPMNDKLLDLLEAYNQGHQYFTAGKWEWATKQFAKALQINKADGPSKVFFIRCRKYMENPPEEGWDGVYKLNSK